MMILNTHSSFTTVMNSYVDSCLRFLSTDFQTKEFLRKMTKDVCPVIGIKSISEITAEDIRNLINNLEHPTISKKYTTLNAVKTVFRYALSNRLILMDPTETIRVPYPVPKDRTRFSSDELSYLRRSFLHTQLPKLFLFALVSGLPLKECAALKPNNIDLANGKLNITSVVSFERGTGCASRLVSSPSPRVVQPPAPALALIEDELNDSDECIFRTMNGRILHPHLMVSSHHIIRYRSGLHHFVNHHMEQNFIIRCLEKGVDVASLEEYYGLRPGRILTAYVMYSSEGESEP